MPWGTNANANVDTAKHDRQNLNVYLIITYKCKIKLHLLTMLSDDSRPQD